VPAYPVEFERARALAVDVERAEELPAAVADLGFEAAQPVVVVVGGAAGLDDSQAQSLESLAVAVVEAAAVSRAAIVDGGTDSGIMRLVGLARAKTGGSIPLVGVVVRALAGLPGVPLHGDMAPLEPRHAQFVLVPGSMWGEEARWIARVAGLVSDGRPSVTVLVNGGEIAYVDAAESVRAGRRVLTVAGTGRTADVLVEALAGHPSDPRAEELAATGLVEAVSGLDADAVRHRIVNILTQSKSADVS
jgi:hypothetical protein